MYIKKYLIHPGAYRIEASFQSIVDLDDGQVKLLCSDSIGLVYRF